jgi:hypothetical protein
MPITCHCRQDQKLTIFLHTGIVSDEEFLSFYRAFYEDPRVDKTHDLLVDLRQAESTARSSAALKTFADFARSHTPAVSPRPKIAVIAPAAVSFGLARMYEAFSALVPADFTVFKDAADALAWLEAPATVMDNLEDDAQPFAPPNRD